MLDVFIPNFREYSHPGLIVLGGNVADCLSKHAYYLNGCPDFVPNPDRLRVLVGNFTVAVHAAANGDRQKIAERGATRTVLEQAIVINGQYIVMRSIHDNDPTQLQNTGIPMKTKVTKSTATAGYNNAPTNFVVRQGPNSGSITATSARVEGAATYELQCSAGDPNDESTWKTVDLFLHCRTMDAKGLEIGKKLYFRLRCFTANGHTPWSAVVCFMVV